MSHDPCVVCGSHDGEILVGGDTVSVTVCSHRCLKKWAERRQEGFGYEEGDLITKEEMMEGNQRWEVVDEMKYGRISSGEGNSDLYITLEVENLRVTDVTHKHEINSELE